MDKGTNTLRLTRLGIDTQYEHTLYMHADCFVCKSEGFEAEAQVLVTYKNHSIIATVNPIHSDILQKHEASLSESAWIQLDAQEGDIIALSHPTPVTSLKHVRSKIHGNPLNQTEFDEIMDDIVLGRYTNIQLSSFITACARDNLTTDEITYLTKSMIKTGEQLHWPYPSIMDKHSVGGIPGNRTTPIVVAIVASAGLIIPKTSSRAITSPAGTADTIETMTNVTLSIAQIRAVIEREGGCMAWGGALGLSPADDIIIRVERPLDIDPVGQMIASVLSKKAAVGATHVVIDIPVGPTAKIRSLEAFTQLENYFIQIGNAVGLSIQVIQTDGIQPLGRGIGPALEARDILRILRNETEQSEDLRNKAILLTSLLLEAGKKASPGEGKRLAEEILRNGSALQKFLAICTAQGGFHEPQTASYTYDIVAPYKGTVISVDNRNLSLVAKLSGAPRDPAAGLEFFAKQGTVIERDQPLYRIHAESKGQLEYALQFAKSMPNIIHLRRDDE